MCGWVLVCKCVAPNKLFLSFFSSSLSSLSSTLISHPTLSSVWRVAASKREKEKEGKMKREWEQKRERLEREEREKMARWGR